MFMDPLVLMMSPQSIWYVCWNVIGVGKLIGRMGALADLIGYR